MNHCIVIKTQYFPLVCKVPDFKKDACLEAISKALRVDINNINQLSVSVGSGIYGIKELTPSCARLATNPVSDIGYAHTFYVEYGKII